MGTPDYNEPAPASPAEPDEVPQDYPSVEDLPITIDPPAVIG